MAAGAARLGYWLAGCQICKGFVSFATPTPPLGRGGERAGYWLLGRIPVSFIGPTGHLGHGEQPRGRFGRRGRLDGQQVQDAVGAPQGVRGLGQRGTRLCHQVGTK